MARLTDEVIADLMGQIRECMDNLDEATIDNNIDIIEMAMVDMATALNTAGAAYGLDMGYVMLEAALRYEDHEED